MLSPWHATAFLYHLRLSALGAADKINIRSMQFSSLIWPTQSAKARRVSILVCCIYFIYYISTLYTSPSPSLRSATHSFASPFLGTNLSLSHFLFHFLSLPSFPSEGVLLKIRPGGFFNVSLEVGFFFHSVLSPEMPSPHSHNSLIWPCSTIFYYFLLDLLLTLRHGEIYKGSCAFSALLCDEKNHVSHIVLCVGK